MLSGRTLFDSARVINQPTRDRRLGVVFQGFALFPHMTVAENVGFGLRGMRSAARRARVGELLERLGLGPARDLRPHALGGQQRTAQGPPLATDPDLLLLDEPLSALDTPLRRALRDDLALALRGFGKTAIVVTHDLAEACQLADQLVVYEEGRVLQVGSKAEVLGRPASPAVATVLGIRNILEGEVLEATAEFVRIGWQGHELRAANWSERPVLPAPGSGYRSSCGGACAGAEGPVRRAGGPASTCWETSSGADWAPRWRCSSDRGRCAIRPGTTRSRSRLAHEAASAFDRQWTVAVQPSAVQLLESGASR
jgi:ABC-type nitrate/sulfonate/bicarbonate transport system ATPase subunit